MDLMSQDLLAMPTALATRKNRKIDCLTILEIKLMRGIPVSCHIGAIMVTWMAPKARLTMFNPNTSESTIQLVPSTSLCECCAEGPCCSSFEVQVRGGLSDAARTPRGSRAPRVWQRESLDRGSAWSRARSRMEQRSSLSS